MSREELVAAWRASLDAPCGHCGHGARYHGSQDGHMRCGICMCFQGVDTRNADDLRTALEDAAVIRDMLYPKGDQ